ncbi:MAG: PAS domain-containing protein [Candidatus Oleimicrobiaceae bacterium]
MSSEGAEREHELYKLCAGVLDHLPWGVCLVDTQGRIVLLNRFQERLSAVMRTEVLGKCLYDSPTVRANGFDQVVRQVLATGRPWRGPAVEAPVEEQPGVGSRAFRDEVIPLRSGDQIVGALILSIPAGDELRQARQREQERLQLQAILDALPAPLMVVDSEFRILQISKAYAAAFGAESPEELRGQPCHQRLRGRPEVCPDCPVPKARQSGRWVRAELAGQAVGQGGVGTAVCAYPMPGSQGDTMLIAEHQAATTGRPQELSVPQKELLRKEIVRQVAQMRARAAYAEGVLNSIEELVAVLSPEGEILLTNRALAKCVQRGEEELVGGRLFALLADIPFARLESQFAEALAARAPVTGRLSWRALDDDERHLAYEMRPCCLADGSTVVVLCARDVSEEVRTQAREMFQEKMASLAVLAGRVAHEINNPLEALQNHVSLLEMEIAKGADLAGVRAELEAIQKQIRQIAGVTNFLLGFTRSSPEEHGPVDIAVVLRNATAVSEVTRCQADITVETSIAPDLPKVMGSESDLERCFVNLLRNAAEAIVDRGVVRIVASQNPHTGQVQVEISDTGVGIPEQVLPHIFDPFFTTKKVSRQAGLGLSLCYSIISDHGGHIDVESQHGQGSRVIVSLPAMVMEPQSIGARA